MSSIYESLTHSKQMRLKAAEWDSCSNKSVWTHYANHKPLLRHTCWFESFYYQTSVALIFQLDSHLSRASYFLFYRWFVVCGCRGTRRTFLAAWMKEIEPKLLNAPLRDSSLIIFHFFPVFSHRLERCRWQKYLVRFREIEYLTRRREVRWLVRLRKIKFLVRFREQKYLTSFRELKYLVRFRELKSWIGLGS